MKKLIARVLAIALIVVLFLMPAASALAQEIAGEPDNCTCEGVECNFEAWFRGFEPNLVVEIDWGDGCISLVVADENGAGTASHRYEQGLWHLRIGPLEWWIAIGGSVNYLPFIGN